jgi:uncharacterized protein YndB with AHSA1/START domain
MSESESQNLSVTLTRVFDAPIDLVFRAWTEAEHVARWMKCGVDVTLTLESWVPAEGATFRTHMSNPGVFESWTTGHFVEVNPPNLISYVTDPDPALGVPEMRVRVELKDLSGRTHLTLTQSGIPGDMICGVIEAGWTESLSQLNEVVAALLGGADAPAEVSS